VNGYGQAKETRLRLRQATPYAPPHPAVTGRVTQLAWSQVERHVLRGWRCQKSFGNQRCPSPAQSAL